MNQTKTILKSLLILFCLLDLAGRTQGQSLISRWQYEWGGNREDFCTNMIALPGNRYLFGATSASDPSCTKSDLLYGGEDFALFILDDNGNKVWEKTYGGSTFDQMSQVVKVPSGGYIMTGTTESGPSGIKTSPNHGSDDIWVVRVDDNFNLLWENSYGGAQFEGGTKIVPTPDGGFIIGGISLSASAGYNYGIEDYLVMKIDAAGNQLWSKLYGGSAQDELRDIVPMADGNYLLCGYSASPADGNKTAPSLGGFDNWVVCIKPDGTRLWDKSYGSSADDFGGTLLPLLDGNYLISSYSPGQGIIRKIDPQGNQLWVQTCAATQANFTVAAQAPNGDIYVGGESQEPGNGCKTSPLIGGNADIWIAVFDAAGNKIGDMDYGGDDVDLITDLQIINGEVWVVGWTDSYLAGNKTVQRCGQTADGWIIRLAHSLYITTPTPTELCTNSSSFKVYFTAYNIYQPLNVFTAQLSDANGSFTTYTSIGWVVGFQSGSISATLPAGLPASDNYKIRVIASLPADTTFGYTLSIHGLPKISLGNDTSICTNLPLTLSAGSQPAGTQFLWNDGSTGNTLTVSAAGTYTCDVQNSCGTVSDAIDIAAKSIPTADIGDDRAFCSGSTVTLQSSPQAADVTYRWNTGATGPSIQTGKGGSYWLQTTNTCGTTQDAVILTMNPNPVSSLDKDSLLCYGQTRLLDPGSGFAYLWNDGQGGQTRTADAPGVWWVKITDNNGCSTRDTAVITRIVPLPAAFLPADTSLCAYEDLTLTPNTGLTAFQWSTGETSSSIHITAPGLYWLQATDHYGCTGSDSILVSPKQCPYGFFMPSAFTPNQDGNNDRCRPLIYGKIGKFNFAIYNRWGQKIFETTDHTRGWDGNLNGHPAEAGTFAWTCMYQLGDGPVQFAKGTVILVR